jgi:hypothetical protein
MRSWLRLGGYGALGLVLTWSCSENNGNGNNTTGGTGPSTGGASGTPIGQGGTGNTGNATGGTVDTCPSFQGLPSDCGVENASKELIQVNTLLVVDKSLSMKNDIAVGTSRWKALRDALDAALKETQGVMSYGLLLYPAPSVSPTCLPADCCTLYPGSSVNVKVGPGTVTLPSILSELDKTLPSGGTPTAKALREARAYFTTGEGAGLAGEKVVFLATDGGPNCNAAHANCDLDQCTFNTDAVGECTPDGPNGQNCCSMYGNVGCLDDAEAVAAVRELAAVPVKTIVLGIPGTDAYGTVLNDMANAGLAKNEVGPLAYYRVDQAGGVQALTETIKTITTKLVTSCVLELDKVAPDPGKINVAVECGLLPGPNNPAATQWTYTANPPKIEIIGAACERVQKGAERVDVLLGCTTVE